jgi:hypothetical protein
MTSSSWNLCEVPQLFELILQNAPTLNIASDIILHVCGLQCCRYNKKREVELLSFRGSIDTKNC